MQPTTNTAHAFPPRNTIPESLAILKIGRSSLYDRIARGLLRVTKDGARSFISGDELARYLASANEQP